MKKKLVLAAAICIASTIAMAAPLGQPEGSPVRLGDSVEEVQRALATNLEPEIVESPIPGFGSSTWMLKLKTKGIYVSFNAKKTVKSIRLEAPFSQAVNGVRIGDSSESITRSLGTPIKNEGSRSFDADRKLKTNMTYVYYPDDVTTLKLTTKNDVVETIEIFK